MNANAPPRTGTVALVAHEPDAVRGFRRDAVGPTDLGGDVTATTREADR